MTTSSRPVGTALLSVSDKTGLLQFAKALRERSVSLLSTGGTARLLREEGIAVQEVSELTGFPEIMDGRVKTLHPRIHGGILGRRNLDAAVMQDHEITPIDLVVVNLYPFESVVSDPDCPLSLAIENIDIGGPAMIRSAAKNHEHVTVVVDCRDYGRILEDMDTNDGALGDKTRFDMAVKAFEYTSRYDGNIADFLGNYSSDDRKENVFPRTMNLQWKLNSLMRYGENPHQKAAFYTALDAPPGSISSSRQIQGKALSYNNIVDTDAALETVRQFDELPACVIVKHANPCGVAVEENLGDAYLKAFETDPESAFGGIIAFNRELDEKTAAEILRRQFVEVIVAPKISEQASEILAAKENVRVLSTGDWKENSVPVEMRTVSGGVLVQEADKELLQSLKVVTHRKPESSEMSDMLFALRVVKMVKSNAIVYARDGRTIGIGAGQMSRVNSARIAAIKAETAGLPLSGAVMASDAFFPFRDGLDNAASVGIKAVIQPGGSMRDEEVIAAADEHGITMVFTGIRHFRH